LPNPKRTIRLVCWDEKLIHERAAAIKKAGFTVDASPFRTDRLIGRIRDSAPALILIDLDRLPSHGRAVAMVLRSGKSTCHIPILFAGGTAEKIERIRWEIPGAFFTGWPLLAAAIRKALQAPSQAIQAAPYMRHYTNSSVVKKLDIKPRQKIALLGAPDGFEEQLGDLPDGVEFQTAMNRGTQLVLWFVRSLAELEQETDFVAARLPQGVSVWIIYPKQTSRIRVDFNQNNVRATGLAAGLVDYKVCAVDADWTGLKFARKKR
jgi:CheY-like chemotaxis protein